MSKETNEFYTIPCEPSHGPIEKDGKLYWTAIFKVKGVLSRVLSPIDGGEQIITPFEISEVKQASSDIGRVVESMSKACQKGGTK